MLNGQNRREIERRPCQQYVFRKIFETLCYEVSHDLSYIFYSSPHLILIGIGILDCDLVGQFKICNIDMSYGGIYISNPSKLCNLVKALRSRYIGDHNIIISSHGAVLGAETETPPGGSAQWLIVAVQIRNIDIACQGSHHHTITQSVIITRLFSFSTFSYLPARYFYPVRSQSVKSLVLIDPLQTR